MLIILSSLVLVLVLFMRARTRARKQGKMGPSSVCEVPGLKNGVILTRLGWIELCCASKRPLLFVADVSPPASNTPAWIPTPDEKSRRRNPLRYHCWCTSTFRCASFHSLYFCFCPSSFLSVAFLLPSSHLLTYLKTLHLQRQPRPNNVLSNIANIFALILWHDKTS